MGQLTSKGARYDEVRLGQKQEGVQRDGSYSQHNDSGEDETSIEEPMMSSCKLLIGELTLFP